MPESVILSKLGQQSSKQEGFRLLVQEYSERLYWHIRRIVHLHEDADDCLQDVFIKVWKNIDRFQGNSSLYTWLYRIATNEALGMAKKNKRMTIVPSETENGESILERELKADPYFEGDAVQIKLAEAIDQLPEKQKAVFLLRYYEELKYEEISEILETSVGALKANFHHAAKKIEEFMKEELV